MDQDRKEECVAKLLLGIFGLCILLHVLYTLLNAKPIGDDSYLHPMWLELFSEQFREGDLYPRWLFETYGSYGSPTFYLYPPLTYFLGSVISFLGIHSGVSLYNWIQVIALALSGYTFYLFFKEVGAQKKEAQVGALVYVFNPYHFADVFARSALSEHVALAFLPILFLGLEKLSKRMEHPLKGWIVTVVGWTLLILTNIPTTVVAGIGAIAYLTVRRDRKLLFWSSFALLGALLLTAFYWIPAFHFSQFIRTDQLWSISSTPPAQVLMAVILLVILSLFAIWIYRNEEHPENKQQHATAWITIAVLAIVLQAPYVTSWLYTLQPFRLVQFGWRFTILLILVLPIIIQTKNYRFFKIAFGVIGISTLLLYINYGYSYVFASGIRYYEQPIKRDAPEYTTKWVSYSDSALIPLLKLYEDDPLVFSEKLHGPTVISSQFKKSELRAIVHSATSQEVQLHQFYWPEWEVRFNGKRLETSPDEHGFLTTTLPAGKGELRATMRESSIERTSNWLSLVSLIALGILFLRSRNH